MQLLDEILDLIKEKSISIEKLSIDAAIPTSRIYSWSNNRSKPKGEDFAKLQIWIEEFYKVRKSSSKILDRIKKMGISVPVIEVATGVKKAKIYKWLDGTNKPDLEELIKIDRYLDTLDDNLFGNTLSEPQPYIQQRREFKNQIIQNPVKFYDVDFSAGNGVDFIDDIQATQPAYIMDVPEFNGCTAFRSFGKSMEPLIDAGAILFATKDESWQDYIEYGQIYGIVCNNKRRFLKYIQKSDRVNYILLRSENKDFDCFDLPMNTIKSIWLVNGWINKRI